MTRTAGPDVRLPKPQQPGRPKLPLNLGPLSKGENPQILLRTGQMGRRRNNRWGVIGRQQRLGLEWDLSQKKWGGGCRSGRRYTQVLLIAHRVPNE